MLSAVAETDLVEAEPPFHLPVHLNEHTGEGAPADHDARAHRPHHGGKTAAKACGSSGPIRFTRRSTSPRGLWALAAPCARRWPQGAGAARITIDASAPPWRQSVPPLYWVSRAAPRRLRVTASTSARDLAGLRPRLAQAQRPRQELRFGLRGGPNRWLGCQEGRWDDSEASYDQRIRPQCR